MLRPATRGARTGRFSWPPVVMSVLAPNSRWDLLLSSWDSTVYLVLLPTGPPVLPVPRGHRGFHSPSPEATCVYTRACTQAHAHMPARTDARARRHTRTRRDVCTHTRVLTQAHTHILRDPDGCAGYATALPASLCLEYVARSSSRTSGVSDGFPGEVAPPPLAFSSGGSSWGGEGDSMEVAGGTTTVQAWLGVGAGQ